MTLSDIPIILGPHANLFRLIRALQKGLEVTSEVETLILKKNQPILVLTINCPTTAVEDFFKLPIYTIVQALPIFWVPRSGIRR